jgi:hypothetical protein
MSTGEKSTNECEEKPEQSLDFVSIFKEASRNSILIFLFKKAG